MVEHTPLPWKAETIHSYTNGEPVEISIMSAIEEIALIDLEGEEIDLCEANAAFIVKAVNNHDALVKALDALVRNVNDYERVNNLAPAPGRAECWDTVAHAKAVLRRVGSGR